MHGDEDSVALTFFESGRTRLPKLCLNEPLTGELADSVDAHHLFEFLQPELLPPSAGS